VRHTRPLAVAILLASASLAGAGSAAAATKLTAANSIPFEFFAGGVETFAGTDCGGTATFTRTLPAGSQGIKLVNIAVGDRDEAAATRVTAVTVSGTVVTVTVLADGAAICDPEQSGVPAGEQVHWTVHYDVRAEYTRRVQATLRVFYESYLFGAKWKLRPKTIRDTRAGGAPGARVTGIRWKRFGGKKAVGTGRLHLDYCRRGDNCPGNGKRIRLVASKPAYCRDSTKIEYLRLSGRVGRIDVIGSVLECSD
jgi:hypothetical protein